MILTALNDYYQRLAAAGQVPTAGFSRQNVSYALVFSQDGRPLALDDIRDISAKKPRASSHIVPFDKARTSGPHAYPLWDKTAYALGVTAEKRDDVAKQSEELNARFALFKERQQTILIAPCPSWRCG